MMSETKQEKLSAQVSKHDESIKTNADGSPENTKRNEKVIYSKSNDIYPETEAKTVGVLASDDRDEQHNDRLEFTDEGQMFPRMSPSPFKKSTSTQHLSLMEGQPADKDDEHENIKAEDFDWVNVGPEHGDGVEAKDAQVSNGTRNDRPYGEESSFALFNHSFDISENGNYIRETNHQNENDIFSLSSPACSEKPITGGLLTPKLDITLPDLEQDDTSECSIVDISPIKVVQRASATSKSSHEIVHERSGDAHLRYTSGTPLTLNQKHGTAQTQQPNYQRKNMQLQHQTHQHQTYPRNFNLKSNYGQSYSQFSYPMENQAPISNPYFVIRSSQRAFAGFNYLLPCIRDSDLVSVNVSQHGHIHHFQEPERLPHHSVDLLIASRRIDTAICTFGGSLIFRKPQMNSSTSIFRTKGEEYPKQRYEQSLHQRYHLTEERISWDVEENPPVESTGSNVTNILKRENGGHSKDGKGSLHVIAEDENGGKQTGQSESNSSTDAQKMKYRCKLCGQPKQKHNCPYSQSLQRDIGVMVHSAVNAYTASEPGSLAPALLKMNNFVSYDSTNPSPEDGHPDTNAALTRQRNQHLHPPQCHTSTVTPQSTREDEMFHSPQSSLSTYSQEISPEGAKIIPKESNCGSKESLQHQGRTNNSRKRKHEQVSKAGRGKSIFRHPQAPLFAPSFQLRPEHYRAVTSKTDDCLTGYKYTPVPATFLERKRLSDTLFYLTREIPSMTSQCATVLREARANDDWDQGVAELMTQVVVGLYCGEGDIRLDGLQQYLLTLGVSC